MKEIKGVGFTIPLNNSFISLDSLSSLSETDIVIFDPSFETTSYSTSTEPFGKDTYNGKICYNLDSSVKISEHVAHWHNELKLYLNMGKTLFVILSEKKTFYIQTGKKSYSGTGRNRQATNLVHSFNNYGFLPTFDGIE